MVVWLVGDYEPTTYQNSTNLKRERMIQNTTETPINYTTCYAQPFDTVIHGNFLNNNLPNKCANLIIADPPYFEVKGEFDFVWNS